MPREGCDCEDAKQSDYSPCTVDDAEEVIYALTDPHTIRDGSVKEFSKSKLKSRNLSICRAPYSSASLITTAVIEPLTKGDGTYHGVLWAVTSEIRGIKLGESGVGAFCVADDGLIHDRAHALLGYSEADNKLRNHREAARGNLKELFLSRGTTALDNCPFPKPQVVETVSEATGEVGSGTDIPTAASTPKADHPTG